MNISLNESIDSLSSIVSEKRISLLETEPLGIRVSDRNKLMRKKMSMPDRFQIDEEAPITASCIEKMEQSQLISQNSAPVNSKYLESAVVKVSSCFLLYISGENGFRTGIAETELKIFRKIFNGMIKKAEACHEAYFGLGKLYSYTGNFTEAIKNLKKAQSLNPNEKLYDVWLGVISDKSNEEAKNRILENRETLQSNF